jgi:2-octaprenyl-6-methoxyphenol hydroxylase
LLKSKTSCAVAEYAESPLIAAPPSAQPPLNTDILIIGAGPVGMTLALALADGPWRVSLIDSQPHGSAYTDPRTLALAHGSRQLLERLRAWDAAAATPIDEIHIAQKNGLAHSLIEARDYGLSALGYVMPYSRLSAALAARLAPDQRLAPCRLEHLETTDTGVMARVKHQGQTRQIAARLIVHAEGTPADDPAVRVRPYPQYAVVAEVGVRQPPGASRRRAWEFFTPDGPLALLPHGDGYSLVFSVPSAKAEQILALDDAAFLATLRAQLARHSAKQGANGRNFSDRLDFTGCGPRSGFPLALRIRTRTTQPRQVWIGNAAQTLHPVSGQGLNLGLRDAWELADSVLSLPEHGDPGDPAVLTAYVRRRQLDRRASTVFTDSIVRLFANDLPPLRLARDLGLLALELCPPLRHFVAKRMIWGARAWP